MKCGMHEVVITPTLGSFMPGYFGNRKSTGVKDELYAKALVIESNDELLCLISVDALFIPAKEAEAARKRLSKQWGIHEKQIMISATHSHTGPPVRKGDDGSPNEPYLSFLVDKMCDAAMMAYQKRRPAKLGIGSGEEKDISFNRRYVMKDGSVRTNPGFANQDQIVRPAGPIDLEVTVMRIDDIDGEPIGVVVNFACHTDTVGGTEYSGDYPAEMSRVLKQVLGPDVVCLFLLGACGNINHLDFMHGKAEQRQRHDAMGRILAGEALKVREKIHCIAEVPIQSSHSFYSFELRRPSQEEVEEAKRILQAEDAGNEHFFAKQMLLIDQLTDHAATAEIQAIRIGEWAIVGLPGEIFVEFGLDLKQHSPFSKTMINTLCNGSIYGYVCTREAYAQGGYEPRMKTFSRIPEHAGENFVQHALDLLRCMR